ncbi:hypothetical protein LB503_008224 [Fusarium chuoi]|nr:hypothetical protein LB503_008224 [Fusarium chuoi]
MSLSARLAWRATTRCTARSIPALVRSAPRPTIASTPRCLFFTKAQSWLDHKPQQKKLEENTPGTQHVHDNDTKPSRPAAVLHEDIYTLPNILTFTRLVAAPVIGYLVLHDQHAWAVGLFAYAGVTDLLDGWIARRWDSKTVVGTFGALALSWVVMSASLFLQFTTDGFLSPHRKHLPAIGTFHSHQLKFAQRLLASTTPSCNLRLSESRLLRPF